MLRALMGNFCVLQVFCKHRFNFNAAGSLHLYHVLPETQTLCLLHVVCKISYEFMCSWAVSQ